MADKIDSLTLPNSSGVATTYDIDLPADAAPSIASLTASGNITAAKLIKKDGTSAQFLLANGDTVNTSTYANQNAFGAVAAGSVNITANSTTDTLSIDGSNVTIEGDATNNKVTIKLTSTNVSNALGYTPFNPSNITLTGTTGSESIKVNSTTVTLATRDTDQTITGVKTFKKYIYMNKDDTWTGEYGGNDIGHGFRMVAPNMVSGNKMVFLDGGKALNQNNSAHFDFGYVDNGSTDNYINIGFHSNNYRLRLYANGLLENDGSINPVTSATHNLGSSSKKWNELYLNTCIYFGSSSNIKITGSDGLGGFSFSVGSTNGLGVNTNTIYTRGVTPYTNNEYSIGSSSRKYVNAYLSGNLTDGTNSITVANIQSKIEVKRFI